ncbi:D-ribose pyranase [Frigoribacterium sp. PvP120]|uniref:D-ribose pyranase n=1 Tax=unclassified Frigoribacterium TaxID=2627005 RepID=UPI001AE7C5CB|nr:D-ribose pyranase [Frigoribacterium sp. PvP121]MBP1240331.1 D-ribose pyranase [Frigoribacterium sp. PvP121]
MKRGGLLNAQLNEAISRLGHGDLVVVADCGLPQPVGVPVVDLAVVHGLPSFAGVLDALLGDLVVEGVTAASESRGAAAGEVIDARFGAGGGDGLGLGLEVAHVSHEELKRLSGTARLFVRTGEATPFANVVLRCGVPF